MRFLGLLESMGLQQYVDVPTHKSDHTLDLIITRCADSLLSTNPIADCLFSDHFIVISDLIIKKPSLTIKQISYRKTKSIDIDIEIEALTLALTLAMTLKRPAKVSSMRTQS